MRALHPPSSSSSSSPNPWSPSVDLLLSPADAPPFRYSSLCFHHDYSYHQNYRRHYCCYIFKKVQIDLPAGQGGWGNNGSKKSNKSTRPEREKRRFLSSFKCVAPVYTPPTHTATGTYSVMLINPHLHTKDTGQHKDSSLKRRRLCTISNACALLYIGRFENWFSIVGEAVKMTSSSSFLGRLHPSSSFFSLPSEPFVWKNQERSISQVCFVLAFPASESPVCLFIFLCFFSSLLLLELQHGTHSTRTTKGARGEGSRKKSPLILCRRKRKEEEDGGGYQQFHLEVSWDHHTLSIDRF